MISAMLTTRLAEMDPDLRSEVYATVLSPAFDVDELPGEDVFLEDYADAVAVVATRDGRPIGVGVTDGPDASPIALLSYLAVAADTRSTGVGSALMTGLSALWSEWGTPVVLGEVHDPRRWQEDEGERPAARLRFYERNGARLLMVPWVQPRLASTSGRVGGMLLLVMHSDPADRAEVPGAWMQEWVSGYYSSCEEPVDPEGDPTLRALLSRCAAPAVPIADISALAELDPL